MSVPSSDISSLYSTDPELASQVLSDPTVTVNWENRHICVGGVDRGSIDDVSRAVFKKGNYTAKDYEISEKLRALYKGDPCFQKKDSQTQELMWRLSSVSCEIQNQLQDRFQAEVDKRSSRFRFLIKMFSRKEDPEVMASRSEDLGNSQTAEQKKTAFLGSLESSSPLEIDSFTGNWAKMKCERIASKSKQPIKTRIRFPDQSTLDVPKETLDSVQRGIPSQLSGALDQYDRLSLRVKENFSKEKISAATEIVAESRKALHGKEKLTVTELNTDLQSTQVEFDQLSEPSKALYSIDEIKELNIKLLKIIEKRISGESVDETEFSQTFEKYRNLCDGIKRLYLLEKTKASKVNLQEFLNDESKKGEFYQAYLKEAIDLDFGGVEGNGGAIGVAYNTIGQVFLMDLVEKLGPSRASSINDILFFVDQSYVGEISNKIVSLLGSQVKVKVNSYERQVSIPSELDKPVELKLVMDFAKEYIPTSGEELDLEQAEKEFPFGIRGTLVVTLGLESERGAVSYRMQVEKMDIPTAKQESHLYPIICESEGPENL